MYTEWPKVSSRISYCTRLLSLRILLNLLILLSSGGIMVGGGTGHAQETFTPPLPSYGPFVAQELQGHDFSVFDSFQIQPSLRVSLEDVQDLLDAIESGRFSALPSADVVGDDSTTTAIVFVSIAFERLLLFPTETGSDIEGPTSRLTLFTSVMDNSSSPPRLEFAVLGVYTPNPGVLNALLGGEVARPATFRWEIKKKDGSNRFWVSVKGVDGFKFKVKMIASDVLGDREIADPLSFPFRMLGDGPGAGHPVLFVGAVRDAIAVHPAEIKLKYGKIRLPAGTLRVIEVVGGTVFRSAEGVMKIETGDPPCDDPGRDPCL